jgi:hypothetical protein
MPLDDHCAALRERHISAVRLSAKHGPDMPIRELGVAQAGSPAVASVSLPKSHSAYRGRGALWRALETLRPKSENYIAGSVQGRPNCQDGRGAERSAAICFGPVPRGEIQCALSVAVRRSP